MWIARLFILGLGLLLGGDTDRDGYFSREKTGETGAVAPVNCNLSVSAGPDITVCADQPKALQGSIIGNYTDFRWEPAVGLDDPFSLTPNVTTNVPRTYTLIANGTSDNLITNGGFEAGGIAPATTGYNYVNPASFAFAGQRSYTIGDANTLGNIWGCTPNGGNWAMAIKGATTGGVDVWCQTVNVTPGAEHMFEAWVMGINIPFQISYSDLEFSINGMVLGNLQAPATTCVWAPFMANWNSGANTTATVCIRNLNTSGTGNYAALDDISLVEKCQREDVVQVFVEQVMATVRPPMLVTCTQNPIPLDATGSTTGPGYTYRWETQDGEITGPRNGLQTLVSKPGTYTFTVTSPAGCIEEVEVYVDGNTEPPDLLVEGDTLSCDRPEGIIRAISQAPDVRFQWKGPNGFNSQSAAPTVTDTGRYVVEVRDNYGCTSTAEVYVPTDGFLPQLKIAGDSLRCGVDSVLLEAATNAGQSVLRWTGPNGFTNDTIEVYVRDTGWYFLSVIDSVGCMVRDSFFVDDLADAVPAELASDTLSCANSTVALRVQSDSVLVGYEWSGPGGFTSGAPSPVVGDSGWYVLRFFTQTGCMGLDSVYVPQADDLPALALSGDTIRCSQRQITLEATTDAPNFTLLWTGPGGTGSGTELVVQDTGWYRAELETPGGCRVVDSVYVPGDLEEPVAVFVGDTLNCQDTAAVLRLVMAGGTYSYRWTGPGGFASNEAEPMVRDTGRYVVEVTGANGCTLEQAVRLEASTDLPELAVSGDTLNCRENTGTLSGQSGTPGVVFRWTGPGGFTSDTSSITVQDTGRYVVEVTAPNGCKNRQTVVLAGDFDAPVVRATPDRDTVNCLLQEIALTVQTGPGVAGYTWNGPGGFSSTDPSPLVSEAGTYTVEVEGDNGCTATASIEVITDTIPPDVTALGDTLTCDRPVGQLQGFSSVNGAVFSWTGPGGFTSDTPSPIVTDSGTYQLTVTAPNGCNERTFIRVEKSADLPVIQSIPDDSLRCNRQNIEVMAQATGQGLEYVWLANGTPIGTGAQLSLTDAGSYTLEVTNELGCTATETFEIIIDTVPPMVQLEAGLLTCEVLSVKITSPTRLPHYRYSWTGPGGFVSDAPEPTVDQAGRYTARIENRRNGCTATVSIDVQAEQDGPVELELEAENPGCTGTTGLIRILGVTGGSGPYRYSIDGGDTYQDAAVFGGLEPGTYQVVVKDENGCDFSRSVSITAVDGISLTAPTVISLGLGETRVIQVTVNKPASEIARIEWTPAGGLSCTDCLNPTVTGGGPGEYRVRVTDVNGCVAEAVVRIEIRVGGSVFVPNAFTPNGDGVNDLFYPSFETAPDRIDLRVFNRWGVLVYHYVGGHDLAMGWDGTYGGRDLNPDVFVYRLEVEVDGKKAFFTGDITLIK